MSVSRSTLTSPHQPRYVAPRRRQRLHRWLLLAIVLLAGFAVYAGLLARDVWRDTMAGRAALDQGLAVVGSVANLTPEGLAAAAADFRSADASFTRARARLGMWGYLATTHGALLPGVARQAQAAAPLLDFARQATGAAATLCDGLRPVAAALQPSPAAAAAADPVRAGAPEQDILVRLTGALKQAGPGLARAEQQLAATVAARQRLIGLPLPSSVAAVLAGFDRREPELIQALTLARGLPTLLGATGPRSYLVVYQDVADVRATGGFIGAASLITLDHGRLSQIDYETSSQLAMPLSHLIPPPLPLFLYEAYNSFELRDANYWPDFPTSAREIAHIYQIVTGRRIDGVVAVVPSLVSYLLHGLGPLAVPGFHETVTAANVVDRMQYYTHEQPGVFNNAHRNRFIIALSHSLLGALRHAGPVQLSGVLPWLVRAFDDRLILASVDDPLFAQALRQVHWNGALRTDRGDYLAVFDQNVTDSKLNPFVDQAISYVAQRRPDGGLNSRVTITYHNRTRHTALWIDRTYYQNYLRVAVPEQSRLISQSGYDDTFWPREIEAGRQLIPGYVQVPGGATRSVTISYSVPPSALAGLQGYRLLVQKQPGSRPPSLVLRVSAGGRTWMARTALWRDTLFSTRWDAPSGMLPAQDRTRPD